MGVSAMASASMRGTPRRLAMSETMARTKLSRSSPCGTQSRRYCVRILAIISWRYGATASLNEPPAAVICSKRRAWVIAASIIGVVTRCPSYPQNLARAAIRFLVLSLSCRLVCFIVRRPFFFSERPNRLVAQFISLV